MPMPESAIAQTASGAAELSGDWRRLRPIALVFYTGNFFKQLFTQGLAGLAPLAAGVAAMDGDRRVWVVVGLGLLVGVAAIFALLSYLRFRYRFDDRRVLVHRGVLVRDHLSVDFSRIQNVSLREPFYARWFQVVIVGVETAGSGGKEITLGGIPRSEAEAFRSAVAAEQRRETSAAEGAPIAEDAPDEPLVSLSTGDLVRYGLSHNSLFWLAIVVGFGSQVLESRVDEIEKEQLLSWWQAVAGVGWLTDLVLVVALLLVVALVLAGFSIVGAILRFHRYRLTVSGETFTRTSGLLTRHEQSLKRHKVQAVELRQNAVARWLKRVNLVVRQASPGVTAEGQAQQQGRESHFIVPGVTPDQAGMLAPRFLVGSPALELAFTRPDRRWIRKTWLLAVLLPLTVMLITLSIITTWWLLLLWPVAAVAGYLIVRRAWRQLGFAVDGDYAVFRRGFIGTRKVVFPLFKVQRFDIRQSPFQRRRGVADIKLQLASHAIRLPYLAMQHVTPLRDLALYHAESSRQRWI